LKTTYWRHLIFDKKNFRFIPSNIIKWRLRSIRQKKIWQFTQGWLSKQRSLFVYKSKSQRKLITIWKKKVGWYFVTNKIQYCVPNQTQLFKHSLWRLSFIISSYFGSSRLFTEAQEVLGRQKLITISFWVNRISNKWFTLFHHCINNLDKT